MKIYFSESESENTEILLSEVSNSISLIGMETKDSYLTINFPFKLSKIPPNRGIDYKNLETVLAFKNHYFSEFDICKVRNQDKKIIGILFKPSIIFNDEARDLYLDDQVFQIVIFRSFLHLLYGTVSMPPNNEKYERTSNYVFSDFYPDDIILGVFPLEWTNINDNYNATEILFNLYLYGFYLCNNKSDVSFTPPYVSYQKNFYDSLNRHTTKKFKHIDIYVIADQIKSNRYCSNFIRNSVKLSPGPLVRFHLIYAFVEIFKDEILKLEIQEKICRLATNGSRSGYEIQNDIKVIAQDSHAIGKFFNKYINSSSQAMQQRIIEHALFEILDFLEKNSISEVLDTFDSFPKVFYYLRNLIVHNVQFLFDSEHQNLDQLKDEFEKLVYEIEFTIVHTLTNMKLSVN